MSFDQLLTNRMKENKPIDFLYPGSKKSMFEGRIKHIFQKMEVAKIEFLNSGEPEVILVPLDNIHIPT